LLAKLNVWQQTYAMALARWSFVLIFPTAAAAYACGSLDKEPNDDYNGLQGKQPVNVLENGDSGLCAPIDAGACSVSYRDQIEPIFAEASCATKNCHLDTYQPRMNTDSKATWENLRRHVSPTLKKPYVNSCTTDPTASYIVDNLKGTAGTSMPPGLARTPASVDVVAQWVACGAPFN
jgi:hypothetical protein